MVETYELMIALGLYGLSGVIVMILVGMGTAWLPGRNVRLFIRLATLLCLAMPWLDAGSGSLFVPIAIVGGFALMDTGVADAIAVWRPLILALSALAMVVLAKAFLEHWLRGRGGSTNNKQEAEEN